jgi:polar amino acid transport system substrate-binding protein
MDVAKICDEFDPTVCKMGVKGMSRFIAVFLSLLVSATPAAAQTVQQVTANLPPLSIEGSNERPGFAYEVVALAHERAGLLFKPEFLPWARAQIEVLSRPNCLVFALGRSPERESKYLWIAEVVKQPGVFVQLGDVAPVMSLAEARKFASIGVAQSTPWGDFLQQNEFNNLDRAANEVTNAKKLIAGRFNAWYTSELRARDLLRTEGYTGKIVVSEPFRTEVNWLAAGPNFPPDIADRLKKAIDGIKADGTYDRLYQKYFPK